MPRVISNMFLDHMGLDPGLGSWQKLGGGKAQGALQWGQGCDKQLIEAELCRYVGGNESGWAGEYEPGSILEVPDC